MVFTDIKKRRCLRCRKEFTSQSAGNRVCDKCTRENRKVAAVELSYIYSGKKVNGNYIPGAEE